MSVAFQHLPLHMAAEAHHSLMQRVFGYMYLFHRITEELKLESTSGVGLVQAPAQSRALEGLEAFEQSC